MFSFDILHNLISWFHLFIHIASHLWEWLLWCCQEVLLDAPILHHECHGTQLYNIPSPLTTWAIQLDWVRPIHNAQFSGIVILINQIVVQLAILDDWDHCECCVICVVECLTLHHKMVILLDTDIKHDHASLHIVFIRSQNTWPWTVQLHNICDWSHHHVYLVFHHFTVY